MTKRLNTRDLEVVRTLGRLRYVTTRELTVGLFGSERPARRCLARLRERDLITPHSRGMPAGARYSAWRLTPGGIVRLEDAFRSERVGDTLAERLRNGSVGDADHRAAISRVYFGFIWGGEPVRLDLHDTTAHDAVSKQVAARAGAIRWRPDGELTMSFHSVVGKLAVVPDATIESAATKTRVFMEMDRSTHPLRRIKKCLEAYRSCLAHTYGSDFPDGYRPKILLITRTVARRDSIKKTLKTVLDTVPCEVVVEGDSAAWLEQALLDGAACPRPGSRPSGDAAPARMEVPSSLIKLTCDLYLRLLPYSSTLAEDVVVVLRELREELMRAREAV